MARRSSKKADLDEYLHNLEEAEKRDHRRIGREMDIFMMREEAPGFPFFLPNGMILKNTLLDYWREIHHKAGYVEISTPLIMSKQLWETSGHWDHYKDNMYSTIIDEEEFCVKPMNCPGGVLVYGSKPHSYRDLPIRAGEIGTVHRHELRGALHGLFRVRCFNQDDAHLFVRPDQLTDEIVGVVKLIDSVYQQFGFQIPRGAFHAPRRFDGIRMRIGQQLRQVLRLLSISWAWNTRSMKAMALLWSEDRLPSAGLYWTLRGNAVRFSLTSRCPRTSTWSTPTTMAPRSVLLCCIAYASAPLSVYRHSYRALCWQIPCLACSDPGKDLAGFRKEP